MLLATATLSSAAAGHFAGFLLTMTGHQNQALAVFIGTGLLNLSMTSWMTPMFGIVGAATASAVATTVKNLMLVWWATRYVGVRVTFLRVGAPPEP